MSAHFFKSTYSGSNGTCVEIAHRSASVLIRDSKYKGPADSEPVIVVPEGHWSDFLRLALNRTSGRVGDLLTLTMRADDGVTLYDGAGISLAYNVDEWDAFAKGVADGQFDR
ncbi:DUF397 domain-containing protein [Nocardia sp. NBC_01503]|uniref:DUF397 domain-containing protein n=1 Tax=Nocardia sp. NBC_01503 TaxID=2975997 RepID=UPI002E7B0F79|nr:DUF397 domain-containing protein [Nocardia sp. NBC_01503]WTL29422.1 DUF397 domain-containing protein [Nocardia sp. NBC_01503]